MSTAPGKSALRGSALRNGALRNGIRRFVARRGGPYQTTLALASWSALALVAIACIALLLRPQWSDLVALQRIEAYKQVTGYTLVAALAFDLSLALIKPRLASAWALRALQITHRVLGLSMLVLLVLHAGFVHQGYLTVTFLVTMLVVIAGALLNLLPGHRLGTWGQWTTALHIAAGCLLGALAVMHLYFVFAYTA